MNNLLYPYIPYCRLLETIYMYRITLLQIDKEHHIYNKTVMMYTCLF